MTAGGVHETVQVHFDDLDAMGLLHNSRYAVLVERAIGAYWHRLGWAADPARSAYPDVLMAVRDFKVTCHVPITEPGERLVHFWLERMGRTSGVYGFRLLSADRVTVGSPFMPRATGSTSTWIPSPSGRRRSATGSARPPRPCSARRSRWLRRRRRAEISLDRRADGGAAGTAGRRGGQGGPVARANRFLRLSGKRGGSGADVVAGGLLDLVQALPGQFEF